MAYFKRHWSVDLQEDVVRCAEEVVRVIFKVSRPVWELTNCAVQRAVVIIKWWFYYRVFCVIKKTQEAECVDSGKQRPRGRTVGRYRA